jgi:L-lactate dehydrogenase
LNDDTQIWKGLGGVGPNTVVMLVANPVDVLAGIFQQISGLPANRVIGSGTYLDSLRLRRELAFLCKVSPSAVHVDIIGEHGDLQVWPAIFAIVSLPMFSSLAGSCSGLG